MKTFFVKNKNLMLIAFLVVGGVLLFVQPTLAADWAARVLAGLISVIISAIGYIIGLVIEALVYVAQYNGFTKADAVTRGWVVVRDLSNMFFVLVLLIISFATILHIESYNYKKYLPKLLLMAILINFSKTIAGLIIDFAQVIMLTFVNGFKDIGAGNLTHMMGLSEVLSVQNDAEVTFWTVAAAYLLGLLYVIIALVIITAMLATLVMRIVMIWIYVVLSPLAFLLGAFPGGQKYASMWWGNFTKEVLIGPILAFFIWLSFVSVTITSNGSDILKMDEDTGAIQSSEYAAIEAGAEGKAGIPTDAADPEVFIRFIVSVGLLLGGLMVSKQIGAGAGRAIDKTVSSYQRGGRKLMAPLAFGAGAVAGWAGRGVKRETGIWKDNFLTWGTKKTGVNLRLKDAWQDKEQKRRERIDRRKFSALQGVRQNIQTNQGSVKSRLAMLSMGGSAWENWKERRLFSSQDSVVKEKNNMDEAKGNLDQVTREYSEMISTSDKQNAENQKTVLEGDIGAIETEENRLTTQKSSLENEKRTLRSGKLEEKDKLRIEDIDKEREEIDRKLEDLGEQKEEKTKDVAGLDTLIAKTEVSDDAYKSKGEEMKKKGKEYAAATDTYNAVFSEKAWVGLDVDRIRAQDSLDAEAAKIVAPIEGQEQLVQILKEALATQNQSLVRVATKKLAKTGNYNEFCSGLGVGTGYDGMKEFSEKYLKGQAKFSDQDSLSLLAEVGEIAKNVHHFGAFGVVENNNGKWDYAPRENYQAAQMVEMSKIQTQKLVRDTNRLGGGYYVGPNHTPENWRMSDAFALLLASKDEKYSEDMLKTGNPNLIFHIASNEKNIQKLENAGAVKVAALVRKLAKEIQQTKSSDIMSDPAGAIKRFDPDAYKPGASEE